MIKEHLSKTLKRNFLKVFDVATFIIADTVLYVLMATAIYLSRLALKFSFTSFGPEGNVDVVILQSLGFVGHVGFFIVYLTLLYKDIVNFIGKDYDELQKI